MQTVDPNSLKKHKSSKIHRLAALAFALLIESAAVVSLCRYQAALHEAYTVQIVSFPSLEKADAPVILTARVISRVQYPIILTYDEGFRGGVFSVEVENANRSVDEKLDTSNGVGGTQHIFLDPSKDWTEHIDISRIYKLIPGKYKVTLGLWAPVRGEDARLIFLGELPGTKASATFEITP